MFDQFDTERPGPPLTDADLDAFEHRSGRRLPTSFRRFLLWRNGGLPFRKDWPKNAGTWLALHWPKHVDAINTEANVELIWRFDDDGSAYDNVEYLFRNYEPIPTHITPIGRNAGNILFFFDTREGSEPRVLFGPFLEPENAAVVADNFMGFLNALKKEDEV